MTKLEIVVLLAALGTFLTRYLPIVLTRSATDSASPGLAHRFLTGLGPAAITTLVALSLRGIVVDQGNAQLAYGAVGTGLLVAIVTVRVAKSVSLGALAGAAAYGGILVLASLPA